MSYKTGFVSLMGLPNAGKSTLMNALVGEKVAGVTSKPQTTRQRIKGILNQDNMQAIFVDSPGWIESDTGLNHFLMKEFESVVNDSDVLVAVLNVDAKDPKKLMEIVSKVKSAGKPWLAVVSKSDLPQKQRIDILKSMVSDENVPVVDVSALRKPQKMREKILEVLTPLLPESPQPLYPTDLYTTHNLRELCSEVIREKCFEYIHQEVPYGLAVQINKFIEDQGSTVKIYADIVVSKDNHRAMVVGKQGQMLKRVGASSRMEIEKLIGQKVFLGLHVKVRPQWTKNQRSLKEFGYGHS